MEKSVREKINEGYYDTKIPFLFYSEYKANMMSVFDRTQTGTVVGLKARRAKYEDEVKENGKHINDAYRVDEQRLKQDFREDMAKEEGVFGHSKEPKLFNLAWEHGHSSGLSEVLNYYQEFVELVK